MVFEDEAAYRCKDQLEARMAKLRFNITMSLDGYVAGPGQSLENPLGEGGLALHEWAFATRTFRAVHGMDGGETGIDDDHVASLNASTAVRWGTSVWASSARLPWPTSPMSGRTKDESDCLFTDG
jgi:hypothetical protein